MTPAILPFTVVSWTEHEGMLNVLDIVVRVDYPPVGDVFFLYHVDGEDRCSRPRALERARRRLWNLMFDYFMDGKGVRRAG